MQNACSVGVFVEFNVAVTNIGYKETNNCISVNNEDEKVWTLAQFAS